MNKIISVNAGSSSLKFQLFEMPSEAVLCSGIVERIGLEDGIFTIKFDGQKVVERMPIPDHTLAVELLLNALVKQNIVASLEEIVGVGHRVVHGGELYNKSVVFDDEVEKNVEALSDLAPLHNPANLVGYRAFKMELPHARHVAVFDTAFHQTMPQDVYLYPIPMEYYKDYKIRRYGFHGTSHFYVSHRVSELMGKSIETLNIITCHLGNGASIAAVQSGKSVNTSMGFTPLAGIMMGTRSGDVDPAILTYVMGKTGKSAQEVIDVLNKKSGMLGVSEMSSDAREIEDAFEEGNPKAILTRNIYANRIAQTIGSYFVQMGGVDAIVFTGGVGENDYGVRYDVISRIAKALQVEMDIDLNRAVRGKEVLLSKPNSKVQVWLVPTNEELVIARDTVDCLGL
ncbi:MAG TPA: acetate kinase [Erysipelotrichaceae bacterium]|nr:acetate kinase [Erysipelotrichaceae bacterium]